jgi:Hexameric tyrosine-coordinated heme protein (HTHP)
VKALRPVHANNASDLIAASQVIATDFATVAAADRYWRR